MFCNFAMLTYNSTVCVFDAELQNASYNDEPQRV